MKKLFALLLVLTFTFASCSDDDDEYSNSDIVGTWVLESASAKEVKTNNDKATEAIKKDVAEAVDETEEMTFSADGKFVSIDGEGDSYEGTYSLKGAKLTLTVMGISNSTTIKLSKDRLSSDVDETEYYADEVEYLVPSEKDVKVSKVITTYTYKKK